MYRREELIDMDAENIALLDACANPRDDQKKPSTKPAKPLVPSSLSPLSFLPTLQTKFDLALAASKKISDPMLDEAKKKRQEAQEMLDRYVLQFERERDELLDFIYSPIADNEVEKNSVEKFVEVRRKNAKVRWKVPSLQSLALMYAVLFLLSSLM